MIIRKGFFILFCFSWSTAWGDKGYAKIARNMNNLCGLSSDAVYPVLREELFQTKTMSD